MTTVILVIHLMVATGLVAVVLWQRSEGGALGIGGGGGGGFLTGRGTANLLTRATAILAACFFLTSITLTLMSRHTGPAGSIMDKQVAPVGAPASPATPGTPAAPAETPRGGILDKLK
jgi:preprotein translocase subunit SecG